MCCKKRIHNSTTHVLQIYQHRNASTINISSTFHLIQLLPLLRVLKLVSYLKHLCWCLRVQLKMFLYQSVGLAACLIMASALWSGKSKAPKNSHSSVHKICSFSVPFQVEDKPTHLYFDSYRQGVQLFVKFLENNKLFQCEAAQPVEEREKEKGISGLTNTWWTQLHDTFSGKSSKTVTVSAGMDNNRLNWQSLAERAQIPLFTAPLQFEREFWCSTIVYSTIYWQIRSQWFYIGACIIRKLIDLVLTKSVGSNREWNFRPVLPSSLSKDIH